MLPLGVPAEERREADWEAPKALDEEAVPVALPAHFRGFTALVESAYSCTFLNATKKIGS